MKMTKLVLIPFLLLTISSNDISGMPVSKPAVWQHLPGSICVLEHTTALFNWTHTIPGNVHIVWEYVETDGQLTEVLAYARGSVNESALNYRRQRAIYDIFPGSAALRLNNVTAYDEGDYVVKIAPSGVTEFVGENRAELSVIPAKNIRIKVTIDGEMFNISAADDGTNIVLPEGQVVFLTEPSITVQVSEFVPPPLSIITTYSVKEDFKYERRQRESGTCGDCRKLVFLWYNEIVIKIAFDIQNLGTVYIKKNIWNQVPWKNTPGNTTVLAHTNAFFNWTHDIQNHVNIIWKFRKTLSDTPRVLMSYTDGHVLIPSALSHRIYVQPDFNMSAAFTLRNVGEDDEGLYEVVLMDRAATFPRNITNVAYLGVVDSEFDFRVVVDNSTFDLSFKKNGSYVVLPRVEAAVTARHTIQVEVGRGVPTPQLIKITHRSDDPDQQEKTCTRISECHRYLEFTLNQARQQETSIDISIVFGIQNVNQILVQYGLMLASVDDTKVIISSTKADVPWEVIVMSIMGIIIVGLAAGLIYCCKRRSKEGSRSLVRQGSSSPTVSWQQIESSLDGISGTLPQNGNSRKESVQK